MVGLLRACPYAFLLGALVNTELKPLAGSRRYSVRYLHPAD